MFKWVIVMALCIPSYAAPQKMPLEKQVDGYLKGITSLMGSFVQYNPDKTQVEGCFWLKRPHKKMGKMRIDYVNGQRIMANDKNVIIYDLAQKTATDPIPTEDTPAAFLLTRRIHLKDFSPKCSFKEGQLHLSLKDRNADITLFFSLYKNKNIKALVGWHIVDIQGNETWVHFGEKTLHINDDGLVPETLFKQ